MVASEGLWVLAALGLRSIFLWMRGHVVGTIHEGRKLPQAGRDEGQFPQDKEEQGAQHLLFLCLPGLDRYPHSRRNRAGEARLEFCAGFSVGPTGKGDGDILLNLKFLPFGHLLRVKSSSLKLKILGAVR